MVFSAIDMRVHFRPVYGTMRLLRVALVPFALAVVLTPEPAHAQTAARKFLRGLAGMTTAILEVPGNMVAETHARGPGEGIPLGFAKGLGMIIPRTLVGVWEFLSAPFPLPAGFAPILQPEFPWDYFDGGGRTEPERPRSRRPRS
jgi:putative exosortase-associated protein (TIGR04073 family)